MHVCLERTLLIGGILAILGYLAMGFVNVISVGAPSSCSARVDMFVSVMLAVTNTCVLVVTAILIANKKWLDYKKRITYKRIRTIQWNSRMMFDSVFARPANYLTTKSPLHYVIAITLILMPWILLVQMLYFPSSCPDSSKISTSQKWFFWFVTGISLLVSLVCSLILGSDFRAECRRERYLGVLTKQNVRERQIFYHSVEMQLRNPKRNLRDLVRFLIEDGHQDDITVLSQLKFWIKVSKWNLIGSEASKLEKRGVSCKICELRFLKGDHTLCIPTVANQTNLNLGPEQVGISLSIGIKDSESRIKPTSAPGFSLMRLSPRNMIEEVFAENPSKWVLKVLELQGGVWTKTKLASNRQMLLAGHLPNPGLIRIDNDNIQLDDPARIPKNGRIVHYSFIHRDCFESKIYVTRGYDEILKELLPSNWRCSLRWIADQFEHMSPSSLQDIPDEKPSLVIPRFYGILDKEPVKNIFLEAESELELEMMASDSSD